MESFRQKTFFLLGLALLLVLLFMAREALVVVFVAFIFASAVLPLVEKLDRWMPRWLAVAIPYLLFTAVVLGIVVPITSITLQQLNHFISYLPAYLDGLKDWAGQWTFLSKRYPVLSHLNPELIMQQVYAQNSLFFSGFTGFTLLVSQLGLDLLSAAVISILMLLDREKIQRYFLRFQPTRHHARLKELIEHLTRSTGGFVSGQLLFMATFGCLITLGLYWIGGPFPPFAILLGTVSGLLTLIPILGHNIAMAIALVIAIFSPGGWITAFWVLLLFVSIQVLANNIIGPWIMGRAVGLHPLAILLALMVGGFLFGLVGLVLAVPFVACLNIILEEWCMDPEQRASRLIFPPTAESESTHPSA